MPVEITIRHDDPHAALQELGILARGMFRVSAETIEVADPDSSFDRAVETVQERTKPAPKAEEPKRGRGRPPKAAKAPEPAPAVEVGQDPPEVEAQDAEDEAAEAVDLDSIVPNEAAKVFTHDDVRHIMGRYVKAFGGPAALQDGPKILGVAKISDIPNERLEAAVVAAEHALATNPHGRTPV